MAVVQKGLYESGVVDKESFGNGGCTKGDFSNGVAPSYTACGFILWG